MENTPRQWLSSPKPERIPKKTMLPNCGGIMQTVRRNTGAMMNGIKGLLRSPYSLLMKTEHVTKKQRYCPPCIKASFWTETVIKN